MTNDLYQEVILEEYSNPKHKGQLDDADARVAQTNASCGDEVEVFVKFDPHKARIEKVSWKGVGCAVSMATASLVASTVIGKTPQQVLELNQSDLESMIGIDEISPGRKKCLLLALKAFQQAVRTVGSNEES